MKSQEKREGRWLAEENKVELHGAFMVQFYLHYFDELEKQLFAVLGFLLLNDQRANPDNAEGPEQFSTTTRVSWCIFAVKSWSRCDGQLSLGGRGAGVLGGRFPARRVLGCPMPESTSRLPNHMKWDLENAFHISDIIPPISLLLKDIYVKETRNLLQADLDKCICWMTYS